MVVIFNQFFKDNYVPDTVIASAPGRVNILGNPTDALEGAYAVIAAAIQMRAYVNLRQSGNLRVARMNEEKSYTFIRDLCENYSGIPRLFRSALRVLKHYFPGMARQIMRDKPDVLYDTEIPPESGLAGSTALVAAFMEALRSAYGFDRRRLNDYIMAELVQRAEEDAGIVCGYADRYVCVMGGLAYMDFRGKLLHRPLRREPLATYERLEKYVDYIPLLICYLGVRRSSGDVHRRFRAAYMREWERARRGEKSEMVKVMRKVGFTAMMGKYALLEQDWETFGRLMNLNHRLVDKAMRLAGFKDGAGYYNNAVISYALKNGAFGAKLSGAGGGGSVIILVDPDHEEEWREKLSRYMKSIGLIRSNVFTLNISEAGVKSAIHPS